MFHYILLFSLHGLVYFLKFPFCNKSEEEPDLFGGVRFDPEPFFQITTTQHISVIFSFIIGYKCLHCQPLLNYRLWIFGGYQI